MELGDLALKLGLALAIGFVIGLERGWKERDEVEGHRTAGLRTFALIGLLGGIFGVFSMGGDRVLLAAGFVAVSAVLAAYMWREGEHVHDFSATSLVAAMLTFILGALAVVGDMAVAAGSGVAAVILLTYKSTLHGWLARITWAELRSGLLLAAMTFIALPLLPDRAVDPWLTINPHDLWLMTILIATVSFAGYVAVKLRGSKQGVILAAALGGLFASTVVTLSLARMAREESSRLRLFAGGISASGCVMMFRVLIVTGLINPELALALAPVMLAAAAVMAISAMFLVSYGDIGKEAARPLRLKNPFDLLEVLRFGTLLMIVTLAIELARRFLGDVGLLGVAALSGLADVDAVTLSVSRLGTAAPAAANAILLAVAVNTAAKSVYAWVVGGARLGRMLLVQNAATLAVAAGVRLLLS